IATAPASAGHRPAGPHPGLAAGVVSAMLSSDPDIRRIMALRAIESGLLRLRWLAAATRFEIAMRRHDRALKYAYKAGFNPDQPRDEYGKWTNGGESSERPSSAAPGNRASSTPTDVVLPDSSKIPDPNSPTGYLQSPTSDLSAVARAGRETGAIFRTLQENPETTGGSLGFLGYSMRRDLSQGGTFDYQRDGSTHLSDYEHVSSFNVGLYSQQAGFSLDDTLHIAGAYAKYFSNNPEPRDSYGLTDEQRRFMELGYRAGQRGGFGSPP
ncbi:MAG: hypothetical protein HY244_17385, partial [Rhizobiales bacterium]|nr:hypothetical protein [Hyphomicrobiales bacterium]